MLIVQWQNGREEENHNYSFSLALFQQVILKRSLKPSVVREEKDSA